MTNKQPVIEIAPEPQKVLLILPTWVGDVVMATPLVHSIHQRFPDAQITLLLYKHLVTLLEGSPWLEHYICWPPRDKSAASKQARKTFQAELKAQQFDLAIMLPNSFRSAWVCFRAGIKQRIGYSRDGRGWLLTDRVQVPNKPADGRDPASLPPGPYEPMPLVEYYAHLAHAMGCPAPGDGMMLYCTEQDDQAISNILAAADADPQAPLVVLCPGANFGASKCWPPERFAAVADKLVANFNATIAISPGPGEEPLAEAISHAMQMPNLLLTEPCISLGELKSLISRSDLLLGNDTGPRHFARAFNVHRVTVFGPTEPRWTETSHGLETIVRVDVPCGPCHQKVCPLEQQICMQEVTVDMVYEGCVTELNAALASAALS